MSEQLPAGWTEADVLALPLVQNAIDKAHCRAHEVCGLWHESGKNYMSGSAGPLKYWVFKNTGREPGSKQPTHRLCVSRQLPKEGSDKKQTPAREGLLRGSDNSPQRRAPYNEDDVPF